MNIVIGSGSGGIAAARALVVAGQPVTLIDTGFQIEEQNDSARRRLASVEPKNWNQSDLDLIRSGIKATTKGVPTKNSYGSNYVFKGTTQALPIEAKSAKVLRSLAVGGLSNVWGSCIAPYPYKEISDWPISEADLSEHYQQVLKFVPHSGVKDQLVDSLPLYSDSYSELKISRQASKFLADMERHKDILNQKGIFFGGSRLAVKNSLPDNECRYCGMCLYGCPYELIYSTQHTLRELVEFDNFSYKSGLYVDRISEDLDGVKVYAHNLNSNSKEVIKGVRVFLAAGILETAKIMLVSMDAYDHTLVLKHSDRFMLPFLRFSGTKAIAKDPLHTLCQLFIEVDDEKLADESVHLQVYSYNDLYRQALEQKLKLFKSIANIPINILLERLVIIFGYLHSNSSSTLKLRLKSGEKPRLLVEGQLNPEAKRLARGTAIKLAKQFKSLGGIPGLPLLDPPGGGNHTGGSFPMRDNPSKFESDRLGRPYGFDRVHIVDSSVFPSLAGATIAFTTMANAHRIATEVYQ